MKLTDCFDRVHVINLPYKEERRERLSAHLAEIGIADPDKIHWERAISGDKCWAPAYFLAGNGPWGCLQSHLRIVQDAIMDGISNYLVLEDDAVFHPRAPEMLARLMRDLPDDWGQLYLGGQHLKAPEQLGASSFILRGTNVNRTHAFALNGSTFARFQQHITHAPDYIEREYGWHIDHQLGIAHEQRHWKVYCPCWWLAGQEAGTSNVSGNTNPRMWWNPEIYSGRLPFIWLDPTIPRLASSKTDEDPSGTEAENFNSETRSDKSSTRVRETPAPPPSASAASIASLELLHFGNNLKPGTWQDIGLDTGVSPIPDPGIAPDCPPKFRVTDRLLPWLSMVAREAMDMGKLPGIQHPHITREMVSSLWLSGVIDANDADLPAMVDYPFNGLFPHPLNQTGIACGAREGSSAA